MPFTVTFSILSVSITYFGKINFRNIDCVVLQPTPLVQGLNVRPIARCSSLNCSIGQCVQYERMQSAATL